MGTPTQPLSFTRVLLTGHPEGINAPFHSPELPEAPLCHGLAFVMAEGILCFILFQGRGWRNFPFVSFKMGGLEEMGPKLFSIENVLFELCLSLASVSP